MGQWCISDIHFVDFDRGEGFVSVSSARASRMSSLDTTSSRFAKDLNLSIGLAIGATFSAPLSPRNSVLRRFFGILSGQLRVGQPPPGYRRCHLAEPRAIVVFALIEPESLFVEIPAEVERFYGDIGALDRALQERPEILDAVGVNVSFDIGDSMIDDVALVIVQPAIADPLVSVEARPWLDGAS